jgi:hypothetical protein
MEFPCYRQTTRRFCHLLGYVQIFAGDRRDVINLRRLVKFREPPPQWSPLTLVAALVWPETQSSWGQPGPPEKTALNTTATKQHADKRDAALMVFHFNSPNDMSRVGPMNGARWLRFAKSIHGTDAFEVTEIHPGKKMPYQQCFVWKGIVLSDFALTRCSSSFQPNHQPQE